jgi:flagellar biosynthetic protein FlhB
MFITCLLSLLNFAAGHKPAAKVDFDLQLFSGEKTEEPTSKRKQEARKKGQVAKSNEVNSVFIMLAAFATLRVLGSYIYDVLGNYMRFMFSHFSTQDMTIQTVMPLFIDFCLVFVKTALPVMAVILIVSVAINIAQVGLVFSTESLTPSLDKINPISGFGRMFSKRSLVELAKAVVKVTIVGWFVYHFMIARITQLASLINVDLQASLSYAGSVIIDLAYQVCAIMIVIAALDYLYQWWSHKESLKMSKQEVKDEYKQNEGDPKIKAKIRERQRAMAMRRMMLQVPKADVVVTNPTHFAVALQYDKKMVAPVVVAKGQDYVAQKIKEIAKENKVVIVENKMLARTLYATAEIGEAVPPELYQAVAEVLAYVYKLKKRLS